MIIKNGLVWEESGSFRKKELVVDTTTHRIAETAEDDTVFDAEGLYVIPGLVDVHIHGARGHDFSDGNSKGLAEIAQYLHSCGVTSFCPTSMTLPEEQLTAAFATINDVPDAAGYAHIAGIHMEGPYLSPEKKGAQKASYLHAPDAAMFRRLSAASGNKIRIITIASFGIFGEIIFERLLQSTGRTIYTLFTQGTGAVLNIIFDPILIFGLFGLPRMEVAGAAVATVLGQIVAFILAMILNHRKNPDVRLHLRGFRPDWKLIGRILAIGVPSMIMVAIGSVMYYGMNLVLMRFEHVRVGLGEVGTAVFGAYYKLQSFIFMPVFGINNAALAIAAYNYGARKPKRILGVLKCGILGATALMVIGVAAFQLIPQVLLGLFNANADMLAVGDPALRTMSLAFVFAGACIIVGGVFQALGNSVYSMIVSIARQLVVLLPVAYLLSLSGNIDAVWFAFPIAEVASLAMTVILFLRLYRKKIRPLSRMPAAE